MRRVLSLVLALLTGLPATANARPVREGTLGPRAWGRGTLLPGLSLGASLMIDRPGASLRVVGGLGYFVIDNLALGVSLRNFSRFLPAADKSNYPGVEEQIATNEFSVTPGATILLHRGRLVSPFLGLGAGPVFLNNHLGVLGEVVATPGVFVHLRPALALNLGFELAVRFPRSRTRGEYHHPSVDYTVYFPSTVQFGFQVGLAFGPKVAHQREAAAPPPARPAVAREQTPPANVAATATRAATGPAVAATGPTPSQSGPTPPPQLELAAPSQRRPEPPTGRTLVIAGTIATFAAVPLMVGGVHLALGVNEESKPGIADLSLGMMVVGVLALLGGVPTLGVGVHRLRRWKAWEREQRVSLRPNLRQHGATTSVGLALRF